MNGYLAHKALLRRWLSLVVVMLFRPESLAALAASPPSVTFSASPTVECRDVTPAAFARINPHEKLVEATFRISALVAGDEASLDEVLIVVASPERRLRVADCWPKTESTTDVVGPIERVQTNEATQSLQAGIGGNVGAKYGPASAQLSPSASAGQTELESVKETFKKLPPKRLLVASGTTAGDQGAFFKLKPSSQASLEGARHFTCLFVVPRAWRGDWLTLTCTAKAEVRRQFVRKIEVCGEGTFCIGLHLEGDIEAKRLAQQLDLAQQQPSVAIDEPQTARNLAASAGGSGFDSFVRVCRKVLLTDANLAGASKQVDHERQPSTVPTLHDAQQALSRLSGHASAADEPPRLW